MPTTGRINKIVTYNGARYRTATTHPPITWPGDGYGYWKEDNKVKSGSVHLLVSQGRICPLSRVENYPEPCSAPQYVTNGPDYVLGDGDLVLLHIPRTLSANRNEGMYLLERVRHHMIGVTLGNRKDGRPFMVPGWAMGWLIARADPEADV